MRIGRKYLAGTVMMLIIERLSIPDCLVNLSELRKVKLWA
jgi:hypothetical protein